MDTRNKQKNISRRKFINLSAQGYAGITMSQSMAFPLIASLGDNTLSTVHGACYHDCPDTCSWTVAAKNGKITRFEASKDNPYTAGKLCSKMSDFPNDVTFHPDRILTPLKRVGKKGSAEFVPISWEQAITEVSEKLKTIIAEKGSEAVLPYSFAGTEGLVQRKSICDRFFAHIGATKLRRTICGDTAVTGVMITNGKTTGVLPEDIVHSRYIIIWGTNTVISNQHLWPLIQKARNDGAKLVVIDPFLSQTAGEADWHIQPMPGTDTALALAMINVILAEKLQDQDYIDNYTKGIDELRTHVQSYSPEAVAKITGLEKEEIVQLARKYAKASPSLIRVLIGMEHQVNGASAFRAVAMLPAITGAWRKFGGGMMHMTYETFGEALNWSAIGLAESLEEEDTRSVSMIQIGRTLNDKSMDPPIHALFVYNSNPAVIAPNQNLVVKGLKREDLLTVVLEHFMTDTARYADYVFPATSQLEHWDILTSWGQTYVNLNQPVIPPLGEAKPNTEFFRLLARKMGIEETYMYESDLDIIKQILDTDHEYMQGISFESLMKTGWASLQLPDHWMPHEKGNFGTPSGKCEFYSAGMKEMGMSPMPEYHARQFSDEELKSYPLQLLTVKSTGNFLNSSHANVKHLIKKEGRPYLDIHSNDARVRNISDGDELSVFNKNGEVIINARLRDKVREGVVCMPQGFWSSLVKGGSSANALTDDLLTDIGEGAAFHETRVEIVKV
jgi:anaerobic selenocysteine-containing dehydrogenase